MHAPALDLGETFAGRRPGHAIDIDPRHRGYEMWASGQGLDGLWNVKGDRISERKPRSCNFGVWWDGDLLRELLNANRISKWNWREGTETNLVVAADCAPTIPPNPPPVSARTSSATGGGSHLEDDGRQGAADLHDDHPDDTTSLYPDARPDIQTERGLPERGIQPAAHTGFYLGDGMSPPPRPAIISRDSRRGP